MLLVPELFDEPLLALPEGPDLQLLHALHLVQGVHHCLPSLRVGGAHTDKLLEEQDIMRRVKAELSGMAKYRVSE